MILSRGALTVAHLIVPVVAVFWLQTGLVKTADRHHRDDSRPTRRNSNESGHRTRNSAESGHRNRNSAENGHRNQNSSEAHQSRNSSRGGGFFADILHIFTGSGGDGDTSRRHHSSTERGRSATRAGSSNQPRAASSSQTRITSRLGSYEMYIVRDEQGRAIGYGRRRRRRPSQNEPVGDQSREPRHRHASSQRQEQNRTRHRSRQRPQDDSARQRQRRNDARAPARNNGRDRDPTPRGAGRNRNAEFVYPQEQTPAPARQRSPQRQRTAGTANNPARDRDVGRRQRDPTPVRAPVNNISAGLARHNPSRNAAQTRDRDTRPINGDDIHSLVKERTVRKPKSEKRTKETPKKKVEEAPDDCTICLDPLKGPRVVSLPCKHKFHIECILPWLTRSGQNGSTCPQCRKICPEERINELQIQMTSMGAQ